MENNLGYLFIYATHDQNKSCDSYDTHQSFGLHARFMV